MPKYDPPSVVKPMPKKYTGKAANPEEAALDSANKILSFGNTNMPSYSRQDSQRVTYRPMNHMSGGVPSRYQDHKMHQMKRQGFGSGSEDDPNHSGEDESVSFIDLPPNNLSKVPEKGILKKPCPYGGDMCMKEKWGTEADSQSDNQEILSQSDNNLGPDMLGGGAISEVERTLKSLNGYHEDILEALRTAASHHRPSSATAASSSSEDLLRRSIAAAVECGYKRAVSQDKLCDGRPSCTGHSQPQTHTVMVEGTSALHHHHHSNRRSDADDDEDDDVPPSCGPIRIRNLEDLIRQLEHHSARHMSPSGSEDIRMSETEADRHYRLDTQSGRLRGREEEPRFVYGRYRQPSGRVPSGPPYHLAEEEGIYETADPDRGAPPCPGDTPDSESDAFIQAQQRLVRSASEEVLPTAGTSTAGPSSHPDPPKREYYPSPLDSGDSSPEMEDPMRSISGPPTEATSSQDTIDSSPITEQSALIRPPKRYPEYKH
uniref:Uncharacterized protein n=1 Tax=Clastoptera arizonana TaxID=38151 RepID=A0A1B6ECV5_9HEMI